jgi:curved DNA-binding protein CbpA
MNPYDVLGLDADASPEDVRRAYRRQAGRAHPDAGGSIARFQQLVLARDVLSDGRRRKHYDETGAVDGTPADNVEARAMNLVMQAVDHVFTICGQRGVDVACVDVVRDATTFLRAKREAVGRQRDAGTDAAKRLRAFAKRFTVKGERPNRVQAMLRARSVEIEQQAALLGADLDALDAALRMLEDYSYDWRAADGGGSTYGQMLGLASQFAQWSGT